MIGEPQGERRRCVTRLYFKPLVRWIWGGVGLHGAGRPDQPVSDRRHRVGAPARGAAPAPGGETQEPGRRRRAGE